MNEIKIVKCDKNPQVLIVTPLLPRHKISKETSKTIKKNKTSIFWLSSCGDNNIPINAKIGIDWYKKNYGKLPPYYIMIDRDIIANKGMIDKLVRKLREYEDKKVAYAYATFEFKGYINIKFTASRFDIKKLLNNNYISSNSLIKSSVIEEIDFVTDEKYKRLLDWVYWLKLLKNDYIGVPCPEAVFIAQSKPEDVSAGSVSDFNIKRNRVVQDFVLPMLKTS
jgi:hypothetical protein